MGRGEGVSVCGIMYGAFVIWSRVGSGRVGWSRVDTGGMDVG